MSEAFEKYQRLLSSAVNNLSRAFYDQYVETNAKFRAKAGLKVTIVREALGECCSWCSDLAGVYSYDNAPDDIYARHRDCSCVVSTRTEKGTWQDAWSRKEYKSYRENRIAKEQEILEGNSLKNIQTKTKVLENPPKYRNVYPEYIRNSSPGKGALKREFRYNDIDNKAEIRVATLIHEKFGGNITLLKADEKNRISRPDYRWNGKLWDLKTPKGLNGVSKRLQKGLKQIENKPGGVIIDLDAGGIPIEKAIKTINGRMKMSGKFTTDIMLIKNGSIAKIVRYY